jgi:hypothetical protein
VENGADNERPDPSSIRFLQGDEGPSAECGNHRGGQGAFEIVVQQVGEVGIEGVVDQKATKVFVSHAV